MLKPLPALLLLGCADPGGMEARRAWLVEALLEDNRVWLTRDPALLETKYDRMADDVYDFMRGTAGVFVRDLARAGTSRSRTAFLREPAAWTVLIAGDPHPENIGTFLPGEGPGPPFGAHAALHLEVNDLDGAAYGPYLVDVRRAQAALALLLDEGECDAPCRAGILAAHARGWAEEIAAPSFDPLLTGQDLDPVFRDLLETALEDGGSRAVLHEHTEETPEGRRFRVEPIDDDGDGMLPLTASEQARLDRLLAQYDAPAGFRVLDAARRYGTGVASLPALRYVVAFDRGDDGPADDELLTIREVVDPAGLPRFHPQPPALFADNAQRIVHASRALWSRPDADARVGGLRDGAMAFKVQTWSGWNASLDHVDILDALDDGDIGPLDLLPFAERLGRQLAATHARAPLASGGEAGPVLQADLGGRIDAFVAERVADAEADLAQIRADHAHFLAARAELGPLLGAELLEGT